MALSTFLTVFYAFRQENSRTGRALQADVKTSLTPTRDTHPHRPRAPRACSRARRNFHFAQRAAAFRTYAARATTKRIALSLEIARSSVYFTYAPLTPSGKDLQLWCACVRARARAIAVVRGILSSHLSDRARTPENYYTTAVLLTLRYRFLLQVRARIKPTSAGHRYRAAECRASLSESVTFARQRKRGRARKRAKGREGEMNE